MEKYIGVIKEFFETGCEGLMWVLQKDGVVNYYDALVFIEAGDHLKVFAEDGLILFDGVVKPDYKAGWMEYPRNPGSGQPQALGFWIHWTQKGWEPDEWAKLFLHQYLEDGNKQPLRAEFTRKTGR